MRLTSRTSWLALIALWAGLAQGLAQVRTNYVVDTLAGLSLHGFLDGQGTNALLHNPESIVANAAGNLLVWDQLNDRVRKITPGAAVTTFAGGGAGSVPGYGSNVTLTPFPFDSMIIDRTNALWGT